MNLFKEVADIKTADQLNLPTPEVEYHNIVAQPTEHQQEMVKTLSERALSTDCPLSRTQSPTVKVTTSGWAISRSPHIGNCSVLPLTMPWHKSLLTWRSC